MLFRLKKNVGNHEDSNGKIYKSGDCITSETDLTVTFKNKFEKIQDPHEIARITSNDAAESKPNIREPKDKKKKPKPSVHPEYGKDVTKDFELAKELSLIVYKKDSWFNIYDSENEEVVNGKQLRKKKVDGFLEKYQESLEEEDDDDDDEEEDDD